jgi:hypothetical protein
MKRYEKFSHERGQKFTSMKRRIPLTFLIFFLSVASPVSAQEIFDMILDSEIYRYPAYSFKAHFRHSIEIKVVNDGHPDYERISGSDPLRRVDESAWSEPIGEVVEKVLERELLLSNLFDSVSRHDDRSSLLLEIELNLFSAAWEPTKSSLRAVSTTYGAVDLSASLISRGDGKLLMIKNYRENIEGRITRLRHREKYAAIEGGRALKKVMVSLVKDVKSRLESLETNSIATKKRSAKRRREVTTRPPKKGRATKKRPPKKKRAVKKANKPTSRQKDPNPVVLDPIGPK